MTPSSWILALVALLVGSALGVLASALRAASARRALEQRSAAAEARALSLEQRQDELRAERTQAEERLAAAEARSGASRETQARLEAELVAARQQAGEQLRLLDEVRARMAEQFQALATQALRQQGEQVAAQQHERLGALLGPLREHLGRFETQVRQSYETEVRERVDLKAELKQLAALNARMSSGAEQLTRALTGQAKTRGDWGEVVLERLLEAAGLRQGQEYRVQESFTAADGSRLRPDVIIALPDDKALIIDSKLPLLPWMRLCEAADVGAQNLARAELIAALRGHVRDLASKNYPALHQVRAIDFVLLFVPVEGAFHEILAADAALYLDALERNVVLVSPTTLLATLRTVAAIWRGERQEKHALAIAEQAGKMYDQLVQYTDSLQAVGERLRQAQEAWDQAHRRLGSGRGNLLRRAEQVRNLGAKAAKRLSRELLEAADEDDGAENKDDGETG